MPEWMDNTFWAMVALVLFLALLAFFGVFGSIGKMLDKRIKQIEDELEEARRLREEAAGLLAEYEQKRASAEKEAEEIVTNAKADAERMTDDAQTALQDLVARRTRAVEDRIAQAESQAVADVRARSADLAIEAARAILQEEVPKRGDVLIDQAIQDVGKRLN
ncbi:ATP synthase subunit b 1 [Devosia pacifica]|uniref:ATP synthase subunit b n=1 Tax=Devosia pacifica TaxID=1335967 RepID=A0A918VWP0_9HYPH|nr:ATP F0F1 synthase subunit B [Devosia pacifica]GHA30502.1 ATP synthase subunit b 1 [Devosia pacifica]